MKISPRIIVVLAVLIPTGTTLAEEWTLVERGGAPLELVAGSDDPDTRRAVESWETFLRDRELPFVTVDPLKADADAATIQFTTEKSGDAAPESIRHQRYELLVDREGTHIKVIIRGASVQGVDAGAAALLSRVGWWEEKLTIPASLSVSATPFFPTREATLCPTGRVLDKQPALMKKTNFEHWPAEKLRRYVDYLRACGFNAIQVMELLGGNNTSGYGGGGDRAKILSVLRTLSDAAHDNGMTVRQYIWGSADGYDWKKPDKRRLREQRYRELARTYGPLVDGIVTHWIDPGHEGGYVVPQQATAFLWNEYRKYNPDVRATVDTWGHSRRMRPKGDLFWDGDPRAKAFLDETFMPREIGVALERWYDADKVTRVRQAGRSVGIWGWYLGDYEMVFGVHLQTRVLDKYFSSLPDDAAGTVDWLSIEMCWHALPSRINFFVAGQKMWAPKRPLAEIMTDYCRSVYGPPNAEAMRLAFETVEAGQRDIKVYGAYIPHADRFPVVRGTPEFRARAEQALAALDTVDLPPDWQPNFPVIGSATEDIQWLREQLEAHVKETAQTP